MLDIEYRALLDLMMCSDPWPVSDSENQDIIKRFAKREARKRGFDSWVAAYHVFKPGKEECKDDIASPCSTLLSEPDYDAGLLGDHGGGNISWWHEYLRSQINRCNGYWRGLIEGYVEECPGGKDGK